ncbi:MAG: cupredoxin family copper-binding protein [Dehalococcoidales bacterium]
MKRGFLLVFTGVLIMAGLLAVASCSSSATTAPNGGLQTSPPPGGTTGPDIKPAAVTISGFAFSPATLNISIGTTVTWTNEDSVNHTVTSPSAGFDSGTLANGTTFSHTFNAAGDFEYHCTIHSSMVGHIIVK